MGVRLEWNRVAVLFSNASASLELESASGYVVVVH